MLRAGPQLFGHLFNYALFGVLSTQVYSYHISGWQDRTAIKALIYGLYLAEFLQLALATHDAVEVLGIGWGDRQALVSPQWLWLESPVVGSLIAAAVQCFYAWRIYILSKSVIMGGFICVIALMQTSAGIASGIMAHLGNDLVTLQQTIMKPLIVWLGGSAICDIIIAAFMLYFLSRSKKGLPSDTMLSRLIHLTVETGALTASAAVLDLVLFLAFKDNNLHMTPAIMLSKLYTNALMMLFNNRARLREIRAAANSDGQIWASGSEIHSSAELGRPRSQATPSATQPIALRSLKFAADTGDIDHDANRADDIQKTSITV
ncbi:hypothetical protein FKP32DRAFT_1597845 [Trametes sanguinea]|nr:hypothetical protein FKP32DRAFT_1597845 [Trametes sanguinea]